MLIGNIGLSLFTSPMNQFTVLLKTSRGMQMQILCCQNYVSQFSIFGKCLFVTPISVSQRGVTVEYFNKNWKKKNMCPWFLEIFEAKEKVLLRAVLYCTVHYTIYTRCPAHGVWLHAVLFTVKRDLTWPLLAFPIWKNIYISKIIKSILSIKSM